MDVLSVFVVDDEQIVREYYRTRFPWGELGMRWVGEAADAPSALEQCRELRPNLTLIDITMPGMNGLQLLEHLQRELPQTHCIILTSHRDFGYAQAALRGGALDYVVKAVTTPDEMAELFRRARGRIIEQQEQSQASTMRRRWLARLLLEGRADDADQLPGAHSFTLPRQSRNVRVLLLQHDASEAEPDGLAGGEAPVAPLALEQALSANTRQLGKAAWTTVGARLHALVASFPDDGGPQAGKPELEAAFQQLVTAVGPGTLLAGGLSQLQPSLAEAYHGYREAERALANHFYQDQRSGLALPPPPWRPLTAALQRELDALMTAPLPPRDHSTAHTEQVIGAALALCRSHGVAPQQTRLLVATMTQQLIRGWLGAISQWDVALWPIQAAQMPTTSALQSWATQTVSAALIAAGAAHLRPEIQRVLDAIQANLALSYDLSWAAREAGLHPNYFSTMFRSQTGQTFVDYLSRLRVERAAAYLQQGGWSIQQVAELVGIPNYRTFFNVFRKVMGMSPSEFAGQFQRKLS